MGALETQGIRFGGVTGILSPVGIRAGAGTFQLGFVGFLSVLGTAPVGLVPSGRLRRVWSFDKRRRGEFRLPAHQRGRVVDHEVGDVVPLRAKSGTTKITGRYLREWRTWLFCQSIFHE